MDNKHKYLKRFLAFVLSAAMVVTYMPASLIAYAGTDDGQPAATETVDQQQPAETQTDVNDQTENEDKTPADTSVTEGADKSDSDNQSEVKKEENSTDTKEEVKTEEQSQTPEEQPVDEPKEEEEKFPAKTFTDSASGVSVSVSAPEGALPEGTTMKVNSVGFFDMNKVKDAVKDEMGKNAKVVKAVDITFYDKNGTKVQPNVPVSVTFDSGKFDDLDSPAVVHIDDSKNAQKLSDKAVDTNGSAVSFDASKFSIYAVVEQVVPRLTVKFMNGTTEVAEMIVKDDDTASEVDKIIHDPGAGDIPAGQVFKGWTTDSEYSADSTILTIADIRSAAITKADSLTADETVTYYAAMYKQFTVTYVDAAGVTVGTEVAETPSRNESASYTVNMGYSTDDSHNFEGWNAVDGVSNITSPSGATADTLFENGTKIGIKGNVKFSVVAPEGHWLVFDENGKGATYNAPQFIESGHTTSDDGLLDMVRNGYTFDGWYTGKPSKPGEDPTGSKFSFGGTIDETTTIYAKWKAVANANYTVLIWKQNIAGTDEDGNKLYDFVESVQVSAAVGSTPTAVNGTTGIVNGATYKGETGFSFASTDQASKKVAPEGNTVVNVYWDRNEYTLNFQDYIQGEYTYTPTTNNNGTQYGLVDGEYVELSRHGRGNSWSPYYWTYGDTYWDEGPRYTGTRYTRSGGGYQWTTVKEIKALYGQSIGDNFPIVGSNGRTYDQGERWKPQNSTTYKEVLVYIDVMPAENVTFHLDVASHSTKHIYYYVEALPGQTPERQYGGKNFVLHGSVSANYGFFTEKEDYLDFIGFEKYGYTPSNAWGSGGASNVYCYYTRKAYPLNFMDGVYVDGNNNPIETGSGQLKEVKNISYGADLTSYNPDGSDYYEPEAHDGYVFEGWYIDDACTHPYDFTTMPEGGVTVYAKWRQVQYRVFLHPNAGTDSTLDWGSDTQGMNFRVSHGGKISTPTGKRTGYEFYGWYTDEDCTHAFTNNMVLNESTVTTAYDKTTHMTDPMDKWGNGATTNADTDRFWITKEFNLYAKWSAVTVGAKGIGVLYDAGEGTNPPSDTALYKDNSSVSAGAAATAPDGKLFKHWVLQRWDGNAYQDTETTLLPGETFTILKSDARITDATSHETVAPEDVSEDGKYQYTVQLKAVYEDKEVETPTHIDWYSNYGSENDGKGKLYQSNTGIKINEAVDIYSPAPTRTGYTFKGWTKTKGGTTADFLAWNGSKYTTTINGTEHDVTQVAADEKQPYEDLYAVWEEDDVTINYAVASDSTGRGTVAPTSETIKASSGTATGSTATPSSDMYVLDYWTCDDGTDHISEDAKYVPTKNADGIYEAHTYYAHFKLNKAPVTVHHYLLGTTTKVADDVTASVTIGDSYTAQPATEFYTEYQDCTFNSYDPSQPVTVDSADGKTIIVYYTLPLTITVGDKTVSYSGEKQYGYGKDIDDEVRVTGLLTGDEISELNYTRAEGTLVGEYTGSFTADPTVVNGEDTVSYYTFTTKTPGKLTITDENVDPSLVVTKKDSHNDDAEAYKYAEGEEVTFDITVKNIYNKAVDITLNEIEGVTLEQPSFSNIAAGETVKTTATYTITPEDMAAGSFTNTVTATLEGKNYQASDDVTTEAAAAALEVTKTADKTSGVKADETITYTITVKNTGNVTVTDLALNDILPGIELGDLSKTTIAPDETATATATYVVKQSDVDAGKIVNTATVTGKDPKGEDVTHSDSETVTTEAAAAKLKITKGANPTSEVEVGTPIEYTVVVTNIGNVTVKDGVLEDDHADLSGETFELAPNASETFTYSYTVTQEDIDAGSIVNVVKANATAVRGAAPEEVTATSTVTTKAAAARLSISKTADPAKDVAVGDEVTYTVVVKNIGNVSVKEGTLEDDHADLSDKTFALKPNEEAKFTYTYEVTQDDVDAGEIVNVVKANATAVRGEDPEEVTTSAKVTTEDAAAELNVTKTAEPESDVAAGDEITYTVVVKNTGNVSVKDGVLEDDHADLSNKTFALAPGEEAEFEYTYTVTSDDVDAGEIVNVVKANATAERGDNPEEVEATATVTTEEAAAELNVTKTAEPESDVAAGDEITYTVVVKNTGNVSVKDGVLEDDHADLSNKTFALAPGEEAEFEYTYTVTQSDVNAGEIVNTVKANATAERGDDPEEAEATATVTTEAADAELSVTKTADPTSDVVVGDEITYTVVVTNTGNVSVTDGTLSDDHVDLSDKSFALAPGAYVSFEYTYEVTQDDFDAGEIVNVVKANATAVRGENPEEAEATATVTAADPESSLSITKSANKTSGIAAGEEIQYTVVVKNEGTVSVKDGTLEDDHADLSDKTFSLAPGESATFEYTYTATQADIDAGKIVNTVKANATAERGDDPEEVEATATVTAEQAASALSITKTAEPTSDVAVGDEITYTVVVKNIGKVSVKEGKLEDDHADLSDKTFALKPNEEAEFTYTYEVTQADVDAGQIVNVVKANATAVRGDDPEEVTATATVTAEDAAAELSVTKRANPTSGVAVGDDITYTVVVKNEGNVSVKAGRLEDDHVDLAGKTFALAPDETASFEYTYKVTQADVDAGSIVNVVKANATAERGDNPAEAEATATVTTEAAAAKLSVTKTANPTSGVAVGDDITYNVVVKNEGNVSVNNGRLTDDHADLAGRTFALAPGETASFEYTYKVTQADLDEGKIVNTVKANATAARGNNPAEVSASATVTTEAADAKLSITKSANTKEGNFAAGDEITYTVVVKNVGNVSVKDGKLEDDHADLKDKTFTLAPGEEETFTYTYTVTKADVDEGRIVNVVKANATAVRGDDPEKVTATATVETEAAKAALQVTKTAKPTENVKVGDTVTYTVTVKNSGNVTVKNGRLEDDHADLKDKTFTLAAGEETSFTYTYKATELDICSGSIVNTVKANAEAARGDDPEQVETSAVVKTVDKNSHLSIEKTTTSEPANGKTYALGETISYNIKVTNDGNVTIKDITLTDTVKGYPADNITSKLDKTELKPGEIANATFTHVVTEQDILAGKVENEATANGKDPVDEPPGKDPGKTDDPTDPKNSKLTVTKKTVSEPANGETYALGETIRYEIAVKNDGNVTIKDITLADTVKGYPEEDITSKLDKTELKPGETATATFTHKVTEQDILAGKVSNSATAKGKDPEGKDPTVDPGTKEDPTDEKDPSLKVVKTTTSRPANGSTYALGETIRYRITVTNVGNVTIDSIKLTDTVEGYEAKDITDNLDKQKLEPGETATATFTHTVTEQDIIAGKVSNSATAKGKDPENDDPTVDPGKKDDPTDKQNPSVRVTKTASRTRGLRAGDTVNYSINVRNTGNVTLTKVDINDSLVNLVVDEFTLKPGEGKTFNYTYTVTAANVRAGRVVNTATATGTAPNGGRPSGTASVTARTAAAPTPGGGGGNPGGGGGNPGIVPAAPAPAVVADNPVPQVEPEVIDNDPAPLAAPEGSWALINLICAALATIGAVVAFLRKKEDDDEDEEDDEDEDDNRGRNMMIAKVLGAVAAAASVITFILTEDMSLPMAMTDKWTLLMAVLFAAQIGTAVANKKASEAEEEEDEEGAEA